MLRCKPRSLLILLALLAVGCARAQAPLLREVGGSPAVDVWITAGVAGELAAPDCCAGVDGGLARRVALLREARARSQGAILLFDGGDLFHPGAGAAVPARAQLLADAVAELAYDAIAPGEGDLAHGLGTFEELLARSRASALCANLVASKSRAFLPFRIWNLNGVTVAVTAVLGGTAVPGDAPIRAFVKLEDAGATLARTVRDLRPVADVTLVFAHVGREEALRLARTVAGIDVLVAGHTGVHAGGIERLGRTTYVDVGERGHRVGHVRVTPGSDARGTSIPQVEAALIPILPDLPAAPEWDARVRGNRR